MIYLGCECGVMNTSNSQLEDVGKIQTIRTIYFLLVPDGYYIKGLSKEERKWRKQIRETYYSIVEQYHSYVAQRRHVGRHIGWLIYYKGELIGCIGIGSYFLPEPKALKDFIGWDEKNHHNFNCNFNKVANNWRFTLMPNAPHNIASRCLSILAKLAPREWKRKYGDELILLVSLVGAGHKGICYKAAGWELIGRTAGSRRNGGYTVKKSWRKLGFKKGGISGRYKSDEKLIFAKPLHEKWKEILTATFK